MGVATSVVNTMEFIGSGIIILIALIYKRGVLQKKAFLIILVFSAGAFIASALFVRFDNQANS